MSGDEFWLSADGEISGPERSRSWRLEPAAYSMILPTLTSTARGSADAAPGGQSQPRRTASTPAWKRVSTPSSVISAAIRRRTVRRPMPSLRAMTSSVAPGHELLEQELPPVRADLAGLELGHRRGARPHRLEPHRQRRDDRALPDVHPRLVGEAERLGQHGVGVAEDEHPGAAPPR